MNKEEADEGRASYSFLGVVFFTYICACSHSTPCGLPVRPCEHSEAAVGEGSDGRLSGCDETHAAVSRLRDGTQRCHSHTHQRWVQLVHTVCTVSITTHFCVSVKCLN